MSLAGAKSKRGGYWSASARLTTAESQRYRCNDTHITGEL